MKIVAVMLGVGLAVSQAAAAERIVGGKVAPDGKWPFHVVIRDTVTDAYRCGGTLIDPEFVVTSAGCVNGVLTAQIEVLAGTQDLTEGGTVHSVSEILIPPEFTDTEGEDGDIALLQISPAANDLATATLLSKKDEKELGAPGTKAYITGYGATTAEGDLQDQLKQARVDILTNKFCNKKRIYNGALNSDNLCAGGGDEGTKNTCDGDEGGPLIVRSGEGDRNVLAGVAINPGCEVTNIGGIFTRVSKYKKWIESAIEGIP